MLFATKFSGLLFAITASALAVRSAVVARDDLAQISVVFFDDTNFRGASYSPDSLVQGVCNNLPGNWLDRAESIKISPGYYCTFFPNQGCAGQGWFWSGDVAQLSAETNNNIESFFCNKGSLSSRG